MSENDSVESVEISYPIRPKGSSASQPTNHSPSMGSVKSRDSQPESRGHSSSQGPSTSFSDRIQQDEFRNRIREEMRDGKKRLQSFLINRWVVSDAPHPKDLAEAGFYYEPGSADRVRCAFCDVSIRDWRAKHDPLLQHMRQSPRCEFINGYDVKNVPVDDDPFRGQVRWQRKDIDTSGLPDIPSSHPVSSESSGHSSSSSQIGAPLVDPQYEHSGPKMNSMISFESRIQSFPENWESLCKLSKESLAEAGFYYDGPHDKYSDVVRCFHCGSTLYDWETDDDSWREHKKITDANGTKCPFLRLNYPYPHNHTPSSSQASSQNEDAMHTDEESEKQLETRVKNETESTGSGSSGRNKIECVVCQNQDVKITFLPCAHLVCCPSCAANLSNCPLCRQKIVSSFITYMA